MSNSDHNDEHEVEFDFLDFDEDEDEDEDDIRQTTDGEWMYHVDENTALGPFETREEAEACRDGK